MAHLKKRDLLQPCLWWPQEVFLGGIHPNHPNQVYFVPRHKPESKHCIAYSLNLSVVLQKRTLQTHILAIELVVCKNLILNIVWGSFETTLRCLKPMQHKRNSVHVCAYYMYAFSSCMWIFARDNKLLICWRDELNYPPPSAEMCSILHSVPDLWNWDDFFFFFLQWVGNSNSAPLSPVHLHTPLPTQGAIFVSNQILSIHPATLFWHCPAVRKRLTQQQMDNVCVRVCQGDWKDVCMLSPPRMPRGITVHSVPCAW